MSNKRKKQSHSVVIEDLVPDGPLRVTVGLDVATNTGFCIKVNDLIWFGQIESQYGYQQVEYMQKLLTDLGLGEYTDITFVVEDFVAFNKHQCNPVTTTKLIKRIGGCENILMEMQEKGDCTLIMAHVQTVRNKLGFGGRKKGVAKAAVRDAFRGVTDTTMSDDESDSGALVLWHEGLQVKDINKLKVTRLKKVKLKSV